MNDFKESASKTTMLFGRGILAKNAIWNIFGQSFPLLVGLVAIPFLIKELGTERFGILSIAWMVIGYFSIFDFGLGRAVTKIVAEKLASGKLVEIPAYTWTAMILMSVMGVIGGIVVAFISPWLVTDALNIPIKYQTESVDAFYLLGLAIPLVIISVGLRGIMEGYQQFKLVNIGRIFLGIWTFIGPLIVLLFSNSLASIVEILVAGRLVILLFYSKLCLSIVPALSDRIEFDRKLIAPLVSFGGWMTISNIVGPIMVYMDRFLIGSFVSMTAVAYYTTPYEMVTKLWIVPMGLVGVLFPAFSSTFARNKMETVKLYVRSTKYIFLVMFPVILFVISFSYDLLDLWLGDDFAENGYVILQLLAVGVFVNSMARVPLALIQGVGKPNLIAITHLTELPLYLVLLWSLLNEFGIYGVAIAWTIRTLVDTVIIFVLSGRVLPESWHVIKSASKYVAFALFAFYLANIEIEWKIKSVLYCLALLLFGIYAWIKMLDAQDRNLIKRSIRSIAG